MQGKRVLHDDDYDSYILDYPPKQLNTLFSLKNREKYVFSELEKLHPCFEGRCKTDISLVMQNGKYKLWAVVVDTVRLIEYHSAQGSKKLYVAMLGKSKNPRYKRVFRQRISFKNNTKDFFLVGFSVFLVLAMFLWSGSFLEKKQDSAIIDAALLNAHTNDLVISKNVDTLTILSSQTFMDSLDASLKKGAACTVFDYSRDRISQNSGDLETSITASLTGLYPEQIYSLFYTQNDIELQSNSENIIEISNAVFNKTVPSLEVSFKGKDYGNAGSEVALYQQKNGGAVRGLVVKHKGIVQTEDFASKSIHFTIAAPEWNDFFTVLSNHLAQNNLTFRNLSLACAKNDSTVSAQFSLGLGELPSELSKLGTLFSVQSEWYKATMRAVPQASPIQPQKISSNKLGTVKKTDGSVISFYASADGKIIFTEE